jgi:cyclopropane-fatty-acyl-phospholipid synthase
MAASSSNESYAGASKLAIKHHYDVANEFYQLWLDDTLTYSCALWSDGDTLESAQLRKLDYMLDAAGARGAERVLDIGCGWGSTLRRLVESGGVGRATGLTLSDAQAQWGRGSLPPGCEVRVENWIDHTPDEPYDSIISIGAFEHFARYGLPRAERVAGYRRFFMRCRDWLKPGGRLALQTNVKGNNVRLDRQAIKDLRFICDKIFPESELPWLSEVCEASEKIFDIVAVRNDPEHYAQTCQQWLERLRKHRDGAVALVGEPMVSDYERYLSATVGHFQARYLGLARFTLMRI